MPEGDQERRSVIADSRSRHPVYLIGPSSVGKSYLAGAVALELDVESRDSDHELKEPGLRDWSKVRAWLDALDGLAVIVDIGAGTQGSCGPELTVYLGGRRDRVILVIDDPHAAFGRNVREGHRTESEWENYRELEIERRAELYSVASVVIDFRAINRRLAPTALASVARRLIGV